MRRIVVTMPAFRLADTGTIEGQLCDRVGVSTIGRRAPGYGKGVTIWGPLLFAVSG